VLPVRGTISFWAEVDEIPPGDPRLEEIYDIAFALSEDGPNIPGSRSTQLPFGDGYRPGYWVDLPSKAGYISYMAVTAAMGSSEWP
jgi:hypothetical protein